jgi:hypothetical protein
MNEVNTEKKFTYEQQQATYEHDNVKTENNRKHEKLF